MGLEPRLLGLLRGALERSGQRFVSGHLVVLRAGKIVAGGSSGTMPGMSEVAPPSSAAAGDPVQVGRAAMARHAWQEAFDQLSQADGQGLLSGADLEALA